MINGTSHGTYRIYVTCTNCGHSEEIELPKGMEASLATCSNCGCSTTRRTSKPSLYEHGMYKPTSSLTKPKESI